MGSSPVELNRAWGTRLYLGEGGLALQVRETLWTDLRPARSEPVINDSHPGARPQHEPKPLSRPLLSSSLPDH